MKNNIQIISYGSKTIAYHLYFADRKTLGIKVLPTGEVKVIAPLNAKQEDINQKVKSKANWIVKQQVFFDSYQPRTPARKFINGETHLYLGRQYQLSIMNYELSIKNEFVKLYRGKMEVYTRNPSAENIEKIITKFYKQKAQEIFAPIFEECKMLHKQFVLCNSQFVIRTLKKRWGSCTKAGEVLLNVALIKAPKGSIEYVMIHELCHLVHYNHSKAFYALQNQLYPDWEKWKEKLEQIVG